MVIDELMPTWLRRVATARVVDAPAATTYSSIRRIDFFRSPVIAVPNRVRVGIDRLVRGSQHESASRRRHFGFDQLLEEDGGFHLLAERDDELVLGFIGRWWERDYGRVDWRPEQFADFDRPGFAVGVWGFSVFGYGQRGSVLVTDVRVRCTDDGARRRFEGYWRLVGPFVTAMGKPVLRLVQDEAERAAH